MASPSINWDDFANQALILQELLSNTDKIEGSPHLSHEVILPDTSPQLTSKIGEMEDSPLLISKVAQPKNLIMLSPDILLDNEKEDLYALPSKNMNDKSNNNRQKDIMVKTPLKNCTNIRQRGDEILTDSIIVTPRSSKNSADSSRSLCPSSAEFKEFLNAIMTVSPPLIDDIFEDNKQEVMKSAVTTVSVETCPDVKFRGRKGTYDLDSPSCDLSVLCEPENKSCLQDLGHSVKPISNILSSSLFYDETANVKTSIPADGKAKNEQEFEENICEQLGLARGKQSYAEKDTDVQPDKTGTQKKLLVATGNDFKADDSKLHKTQLSKISSLRRPQFSNSKEKTIHKSENLQEHKSKIDTTSPAICSEEESITTISLESVVSDIRHKESGKLMPEDVDKLQGKVELPLEKVSDASENSPKTQLDGGQCEALSVSSLEAQPADSHKMFNSAPKQASLQYKRLSTSHIGKANTEADTRASSSQSKITPLTKMSLVKPGQLQSTESLKRRSTGLVRQSTVILKRRSTGLVRQSTVILKRQSTELMKPITHNALKTEAQDQEATKSDAVIPPKVAVKPRASLGHSETQRASKMIPKLTLRPPSKTAEQSQQSLKYQQLPGKQRTDMKMTGQSDVKTMQPSHALNKQDVPKPVDTTNVKRRCTLVKGIYSSSTVNKVTSTAINPTLSVIDASKTVTREAVKRRTQAVASSDESIIATNKVSSAKDSFVVDAAKTVTKEVVKRLTKLGEFRAMTNKTSPAKDLFVTDIAKTVTKEVVKRTITTDESGAVTNNTSPPKGLLVIDAAKTVTKEKKLADSRTVTREAQPALSKTVTKSSGDQLSAASGDYIGTPMIGGDKFLVPKRLSNVFHISSASSVNDRGKKHGSSIPMFTGSNRNSSNSSQGSVSSNSSFKYPSFESPYPGMRSSADESDVFKPNQTLVQHTPDVEPRRLSMWSPVKRNRLSGEDSVYQCTKRHKEN